MFDSLFRWGSSAALLGWLLLLLAPRWQVTALVSGGLVPALLAMAYAALIGTGWSAAGGGFGSVAEVRALFQSDALLVAGWLHYLAFDLLVGRWIVGEAARVGLGHWSVVPALLATFTFGPAGWLLFQLQRKSRAWVAAAAAAPRLPQGLRSSQPLLAATGVALLLLLLPTGLAHVLDVRTLGAEGPGVWLKPLKFQLSLGVYLLTLAVLYPLAGPAFGRSAAGRFVVWAPVLAALFELAYIGWRALQGEASHFNVATPLAARMYMLMGVGAVLLTLAAAVLAVGVARWREPGVSPALRSAVLLGLAITFVLGTAGGVLMSGGTSTLVGAAASGPGMSTAAVPFFGWSLQQGDQRVAHFAALHAVQVVPLFALVWQRWQPAQPATALAATRVFALLYAAFTVALFAQARAGWPLWPLWPAGAA